MTTYAPIPTHPKFVDLTGRVFGEWTVLGFLGADKGSRYWSCKCCCGAIQRVNGGHLAQGRSRSCGCVLAGSTSVVPGERFGRIVTIEESRKGGRVAWKCRCDCGVEWDVLQQSLLSGHTKSCGCQKLDLATTHGMTGSKEYKAWAAMVQRCRLKTSCSYSEYGGRGIRVCERWENSFEAFLEDMGPRPSPQHSIDRIDNDGDYEPGNCRWATAQEQNRNKRSNVILSHNGKEQCVAAWSAELGISWDTIRSRIDRGWSAERALSTTPHAARTLTVDGTTRTVAEWSSVTGTPVKTIYRRIYKQWSDRDAVYGLPVPDSGAAD